MLSTELALAQAVEDLQKRVKELEAEVKKPRQTVVAGGGTADHGALNGLTDDDHTQYVNVGGDTMTGALTLPALDVVDASTSELTMENRDLTAVLGVELMALTFRDSVGGSYGVFDGIFAFMDSLTNLPFIWLTDKDFAGNWAYFYYDPVTTDLEIFAPNKIRLTAVATEFNAMPDFDLIDINATSVSTVQGVIPITAEGTTRYIPFYQSYT